MGVAGRGGMRDKRNLCTVYARAITCALAYPPHVVAAFCIWLGAERRSFYDGSVRGG